MTSTISSAKQRRSDIKLLAIITTIVLLSGFFIAGTILFLSRGDAPGPCGKVNAGDLSNLVKTASVAPSFVAFGGNCQYWLALRDSRLVAIKPSIESLHCNVDWRASDNQFTCGGRKITFADMQYFPTSVGTGAFKGSWIVDFGDERTKKPSVVTTPT